MKLAILAFAALALTACSSSPVDTILPAPESLKVDPAAAGWKVADLDAAVAYVKSQKTTGFLVMQEDRIIAEYNWPLPDDAAQFKANFVHGASADGALIEDVASQQKSFIALLAAIAIDRKLLDIEKPVSAYLGAGWSKAPADAEAKILVRHLMEMSSGLKENRTFEAPAGTKFFYNTPVYATMKPVLEKAAGQSLDAITRDWLATPAGMTNTSWAKRPGAFADAGNPTGLATTPRDVAMMGQVVLNRGHAMDGRTVVSWDQLQNLLRPSPTNANYGRLWWLNGQKNGLLSGGRPASGWLIPAAPGDTVAALGAQGRKLYVVPSLRVVVVRMGQNPPDEREFDQKLWQLLAPAIPKP
jgi:CubicO group peptidase (beta-lactamase class C family)